MTLACAYRHEIETTCEYEAETVVGEDLAKTVFTTHATAGETLRITKLVSYHSSRGIPPQELADRCKRTIKRARATGVAGLQEEQRSWLDAYWTRTDVEVEGDDEDQQADRKRTRL